MAKVTASDLQRSVAKLKKLYKSHQGRFKEEDLKKRDNAFRILEVQASMIQSQEDKAKSDLRQYDGHVQSSRYESGDTDLMYDP